MTLFSWRRLSPESILARIDGQVPKFYIGLHRYDTGSAAPLTNNRIVYKPRHLAD